MQNRFLNFQLSFACVNLHQLIDNIGAVKLAQLLYGRATGLSLRIVSGHFQQESQRSFFFSTVTGRMNDPAFFAFWILGVPSAIVWGVVMVFLSMIPMLGAFLVWVPAAIYLGLTGHPVKALIMVLWGTLVIGMADNFLRPKLVGERTKLHELLIFFAVLGGLQVFGVLGIVLGPVVLAITLALVDVFKAADREAKA
jgi:predicted PurR-regulated permease PerM